MASVSKTALKQSTSYQSTPIPEKANSQQGSQMFSRQRSRRKILFPDETHSQQAKLNLPKKSSSVLREYRVIYDGVDVTPLHIDPSVFESTQQRQQVRKISCPEDGGEFSQTTDMPVFGSQSVALFKTQLYSQNLQGDAALHSSSAYYGNTSEIIDTMIESESTKTSSDSSKVFSSKSSGSQAALQKIPQNITLVLNETETFFLLELPSSTTLKGTEEGDAVEEDNKQYEYLTTGKGRNRRTFEAEAQTTKILLKTRSTQADRTKRKNIHTFASNWETYDTLHEATKENFQGEKSDSDEEVDNEQKTDTAKSLSIEKQFAKLVKTSKFQEALCVIERLLANNCYNEQQKRFRGLSDPCPFRESVEYKYKLNLLWTFRNEKTQGRCVTSMHWNKQNQDIVAVGYGKFYYNENTTGMIMLWNIKNPDQPERTYNFEYPVTSVAFSNLAPNLLAVGFYNGSISVIDVSSRELKVMSVSSRQDSPSFEAAWHVIWDLDEETGNKEHIIACFEDGRVCKYILGKGSFLKCLQIMHVARAEGRLKGINIMRICETATIPVSRFAAALFITKHPMDQSIYYAGTNEGVVHKCSTNYYNQHLDLSRAHNGPVYQMKFSPYCDRLYVTCGDDWYLRLWAEGIPNPIAEMTKSIDSIQGIDWSPTHSTILVAIRGKMIDIWDIQRKIYSPQSVHSSPTNSRNTVVKFTDSGRCLVVGDIDGNIHVFSLEDMPFPAFFQDDLLIQSLKRVLVARPDLLSKLRKLGKLSFKDKNKT